MESFPEFELPSNILHTREAYDEAKQFALSEKQAHSLINLVIDNPWLKDEEKDEFRDWSNYFFSNNKEEGEYVMGKGKYILRPGKDGIVDLLRMHPNSINPQNGESPHFSSKREAIRESIDERVNEEPFFKRARTDRFATPRHHSIDADGAIDRVMKNTNFTIMGKEIFDNPEKAPLEFQYAAGLAGEETLLAIKDRLEKGDKLAFMQVKKLTPETHKALQTVIEAANGSVSEAIAYILSGNREPLSYLSAERQVEVGKTAEIAREGARMLIHFKILTNNPGDEEIEKFEEKINSIIDANIDVPYAYWRYTVDGFKEDVQVAAASLGFGAAVAAGLSAIGFGSEAKTAQQIIKEGIKEGVPALVADATMNFATGFAESQKGKKKSERIKETAGILADKYKLAVGVGILSSVGLGILSKEVEMQSGSQLLASIPLALTAVIPTKVTQMVTERLKRAKSRNSQEKDTHPIHDSLMVGSKASAAATLGIGALNLIDNALAVTGATELVEPVVIVARAVKILQNSKKKYIEEISLNPQKTYTRAMKNPKIPEVQMVEVGK
ncbi:hypothetical protein M1349_02475 [Patescibacteria group bacterium]|nr:hypothetical protein [Patescibacteria group bacterium]